ncbi:unnamed protein product [Choristocarpus tenellus]
MIKVVVVFLLGCHQALTLLVSITPRPVVPHALLFPQPLPCRGGGNRRRSIGSTRDGGTFFVSLSDSPWHDFESTSLDGGNPVKKDRVFDYLVTYPCEFEIKVIGLNEENFAADIAAIVGHVCKVGPTDVRFSFRDTSSGKYRSVTLHAPVTSASMLYECYEMINKVQMKTSSRQRSCSKCAVYE